MLRIAVCDDTWEDCQRVRTCTEAYFRQRHMEAVCDVYQEAEELLKQEKRYDLYLLDVMMPGMTGLEAAEKLHRKSGATVIIFITSSLEAAVEGYRVNAAGFLLKPVQEEAFQETMTRVLEQRLQVRAAVISVIHNRVPLTLRLSKVISFENRLHRVYVNLSDGEVLTLNQKIGELQEKLKPYEQFLRCHQSYIVNLNQVERMEAGAFMMMDGQMVPVSRNFYKESKNAYYHHLLK